MIFLFHQWQKCHDFLEKINEYNCFELIRHALDDNPDPDPENDADPTRSGSKTLLLYRKRYLVEDCKKVRNL
jgi:hypothetical protein